MSPAPIRTTACLAVSLALLTGAHPIQTASASSGAEVLPSTRANRSTSGAIVAVGGGGTPEAVVREAVRIARKRFDLDDVTVVVMPHASQREDRGVGSAEMWGEAPGVRSATILSDEPEDARAALGAAHIVWMGGGSQSRLLDHITESKLGSAIEEAHARGAVIGGTSAGAAVLGSTTIFGRPDPVAYVAGSVENRTGLGLVPDAIVDQHFRERGREGRLVTSVLDVGPIVGFGISERTALVFEGESARVLGEGPVLVIDARSAEIESNETAGSAQSARNMKLCVLAPGQEYELAPNESREMRDHK